jgi:glycine dehydrogenase
MKKLIKKVNFLTRSKVNKKYSLFNPNDTFQTRHLGFEKDTLSMLKFLNIPTLEELIQKTIPKNILNKKDLDLGDKQERGESELIEELKEIGSQNVVKKNLIGLGYYECITPYVILRNVLEDPGW